MNIEWEGVDWITGNPISTRLKGYVGNNRLAYIILPIRNNDCDIGFLCRANEGNNYITPSLQCTFVWSSETHCCPTIEEAKARCQRHYDLLVLQ